MRGVGAHFMGRGRTGEPKVVLLPRPGLFSRIGRGHVKLHVLDLPITQAVHEVVDLSPGDLPASSEDTPQCWVINEGAPSTGPPPSGALQTSHPRPCTILSLSSPPTLEASLKKITPPSKVHLESSASHGGATS